MKTIAKSILIVVLFFLVSIKTNAQQNFLNEANASFDNRAYFSSISLYQRAYAKERNNATKAFIIFRIAECYRNMGDPEQSEIWYSKAIEAGYDDPLALFYLAEAYRQLGKNEAAKQNYKKYKEKRPDDKRATIGLKSVELAADWIENPTRWKVENLVMLNTKEREFCPSFADNNYKKLYFTSTRAGIKGGEIDQTIGEGYSDVFVSSLDNNGKWSTAIPLDAPVTTEDNEGLTSITKKGDMLFWTRCIPEKNKIVYNQLWAIHKSGEDKWEKPEKLPFNNDTTKFASPAISPDGKILVFASNLVGGYGENDLWMSRYDVANDTWSEPVNLGAEINTPGNDVFPYIADDNALYFSSEGHEGMGGLDIYKAESTGNGKWGKVENMKYPINSNADDFGIIFEGTTKRGYLSSNRTGTKGSDDIWSVIMPPLLFSVIGEVNDDKYHEPVPDVVVILTGSDGSRKEIKTGSDGKYNFLNDADGTPLVKENTSYTVTLSVPKDLKTKRAPNGFLNSSAKFEFTTIGATESKTFSGPGLTLLIKPIETEIPFPAVLYDKNMATLRPESKDSLDYLYQILIDNPDIVIELSAHTDSRGTNLHNATLSQARAQSCYDYLVSKGIPADRMVPKGYGEERLKITDAQIEVLTTEEEKEAAHQKNRRTVFRVLRRDYDVKKN